MPHRRGCLRSVLVKAIGIGHTVAMRWHCVTSVLLLSVVAAFADVVKLDTLTVGSVTYSNVTILGANATDLYFSHQYGIGNVKLKYLSPSLQKKFNYDPSAAAATERKRAEEDARYQTTLASEVASRAAAAGETEPAPEQRFADPISEHSFLGKPAPQLTVEKWLTDKPTMEGKFVLVCFWSPESAACRQWIPEFNSLSKAFTNNLAVIGLCSESEDAVANMVSPKIEFASALDSKARLRSALAVTSVPTVLFIDPDGITRYVGHPAAITPAALQRMFPKAGEPAATKP